MFYILTFAFLHFNILTFASHNQLHIYCFSDVENLLRSTPGMELHKRLRIIASPVKQELR